MKKYILNFTLMLSLLMAGTAHAVELNLGQTTTSIRLLELNHSSAVLDVTIHSLDVTSLSSDRGDFTVLTLPGYHSSLQIGAPNLPGMNRLLRLPEGEDFPVTIEASETELINLQDLGFKAPVIPVQAPVSKSSDPAALPFEQDQSIYTTDAFWQETPVTLEILGHLRDANTALLKIRPVAYNPVSGELRIQHHLRLRIDLSSASWSATREQYATFQTPVFSALQQQLTDLTRVENEREDLVTAPVKMVIVSDPMFQATLQPFVQWKTRQGFTVIEGYTGTGDLGTSHTAIEAWLQDIYNSGTADDPAPSYVLLVGDTGQIPAPNGSAGSHVTDRHYAEMTGDILPDMYLGRFPAATVEQLQAILDKTLMYEQYTMADPTYLHEVVMIAGMDGTYGPTHGNGQINYGTQQYFNLEHGILSHTYLYPNSGSSAGAIIANLSEGVAFVNYTAHGSPTSWADPYVSISNVNSLNNSQQYFTAIANACLTAKFDTPECIGEAFIRRADKGAIGYIGGTNSTYWNEDYYWGVGNGPVIGSGASYEQTGWGMYDGLFHDHGEPESEWTVTNGAMVYRGNLAVTESGSSLTNYYWEIYELFGDPSLMTYMGVPAQPLVSAPDVLIMGNSSLAVSVPPYAYVALNFNNQNLAAVQADENGDALLTFDPGLVSPGDLELVVTAQNYQPYIGTIAVVTPDGPYLLLAGFHIDDTAAGNGNGQADFGEDLDLYLDIYNVGVDTAYAVNATLSSTDLYLNILTQAPSVALLPPDSMVSMGPVNVIIDQTCPDAHESLLDLFLAAGLNTWTAEASLLLNAPVLAVPDVLVNDGGNHRLDIGETTSLNLAIANQGGADVSGLQFDLSVEDAYVDLPDGPLSIGLLAGPDTLSADFAITVSPETPAGHQIVFNWMASGDLGYFASGSFTLTAGLVIADFETGDFSGFDWVFAGHANWQIQTQEVFEGNYAARSGDIGDNQNSELNLVLDVTAPGTLSFRYKVSSEEGTSSFYDGLKFYIDGILEDEWQGEIPWSEASYIVAEGPHDFTWKYEKDGSVSHGSDCAWLDFVVMPPTSQAGGGLGDINSDGHINIQDVIRIVNIILGQGAAPTAQELYYADLNGDEMVDIGDLVALVNIIIGGDTLAKGGSPDAIVKLQNHVLHIQSDLQPTGLEMEFTGDLQVTIPGFQTASYRQGAVTHQLIYALDGSTLPDEISLTPGETDFTINRLKLAWRDGSVLEPELKVLPESYQLYANYPNPFNPSTNIAYDLPRDTRLTITVYDLRGQEIWTTGELREQAGNHVRTWEGLTTDGRPAASGVYLITLSAPEFHAVQKAVLIR